MSARRSIKSREHLEKNLKEVGRNAVLDNPDRFIDKHMYIERSNETEYLGKFIGLTEKQNIAGVSYIFKDKNDFVIEFVSYAGDMPVFKVSESPPTPRSKDKSKSPSTPRAKDKSKSPPNKTKSKRSVLPPINRKVNNWTGDS